MKLNTSLSGLKSCSEPEQNDKPLGNEQSIGFKAISQNNVRLINHDDFYRHHLRRENEAFQHQRLARKVGCFSLQNFIAQLYTSILRLKLWIKNKPISILLQITSEVFSPIVASRLNPAIKRCLFAGVNQARNKCLTLSNILLLTFCNL